MALELICSNCGGKIVVQFLNVGDECVCQSCGQSQIVTESAKHTDESSTIAVATTGDQTQTINEMARRKLKRQDFAGKRWGSRILIAVAIYIVTCFLYIPVLYIPSLYAFLLILSVPVLGLLTWLLARKTRGLFWYDHHQSGFYAVVLLLISFGSYRNCTRYDEETGLFCFIWLITLPVMLLFFVVSFAEYIQFRRRLRMEKKRLAELHMCQPPPSNPEDSRRAEADKRTEDDMLPKCPICGALSENGYRFCASCGTPLKRG